MKKLPYVLTVLVTLAIVVLSTIPIPENPPLGDVPLMDKWVHMVMYGGLVFVMWVDRVVIGRKDLSRQFLLAMFLYAVLLGGLMELVQAWLTTCRSGEWLDFEADAVGALAMSICCIYLNKLWKEKTLARR